MKKRILSIVVVLAILLSMMPLSPMTSFALVEGDWHYTLYDGDTTAAITGYSGTAAEIVIPSMIAGKPVTRIVGTAFTNNTTITSVKMPNSLQGMDNSVFSGCTNLNSVDFGSGLQNINPGAFSGCSSLQSIILPSSLSSVGEYAFYGCTNLQSVIFEGNAPTMGQYVFSATHTNFIIYYYSGATGFTTPTWEPTLSDSHKTIVLDPPEAPVQLDLATGNVVIKANAYDFGTSTNIQNSSNSYIITQTNSESPTANTITIQGNADASITLDGVNINSSTCALGISSDSKLTLILSGANFLQSGLNRAGLEVPAGAELVILGTSVDKLTVIGGDYSAGIGGGHGISGGKITIEGGEIITTGGNAAGGTGSGSGIGGGRGGSGGMITISGGKITSTGGYRASGIGGGTGGSSGIILIKDGSITATAPASSYSAGIGGGYDRGIDIITIEGGTIVAIGDDGAGIGGGRIQNTPSSSDGGTLNISGGNITASSIQGAGIGGGLLIYISYVMPTTVNITGGTINTTSSSDAGIGSNEGVINISGGHITATSTGTGAGIGGRYRRTNGGTINISGGTIIAQGGTVGGAGIGGGHYGDADNEPGSTINITGGDITATGGQYSAGIGGGYGTTAGEITITGGIINALGKGGSAIGMGSNGWSGNGGDGKIAISKAIINVSIDEIYSLYAINAGGDGTIHIGFTGEPSEWVCDPVDNRAEITFSNGGLSLNGLVFGTCLIEGAGEIDGSYIEGIKIVYPFTGTGTQMDPYKISTEADLISLAQLVSGGESFTGKYFEQTQDIELTQDWIPIGWIGSYYDTNIPFNGYYDGQSKMISNLTIKSGISWAGLFSVVGIDGVIDSIELENATITGGALVGSLTGELRGIIRNCIINGSITGNFATGGLVGQTYDGLIEDCHSIATVTGTGEFTGGLVGYAFSSYGTSGITITSSSSSGNVNGYNKTGGLIGGLQGGRCIKSFATGTVSGTNRYTGGLVGAIDSANGFIASVEDCYASASIIAPNTSYVGGLAGANWYGTIQNSYAAGTINLDGVSEAGGLTGTIYTGAIALNSYYDSSLCGLSDTGKGIPKTSEEMKDQTTFNTWSFPNIWTLSSDNNGYPALAWQGFTHEIISDDATLSSITASGITLAPVFESAVTNYTASVANHISSTTIAATSSDSSATVKINGLESTNQNVTLNVGENVVTVKVTAEDGITTQTYTVTINRASTGSSGSSGGSSYTPPAIIVITEEQNTSTTNRTVVPSSNFSGTTSATVTKAIVDALLDKIDSVGGSEKNDLIQLDIETKADINELKVSILQRDFKEISEQTDASLRITSPFISIIFDAKALETITAAESGGMIVISAGVIDNNSLSEADQFKVKNRPVYNLTVMNGDTKVSDFSGGYATVTIPYTLLPGENPNAVVVYYLADNGSLEMVRGHYNAALKSVVFKTAHFSNFVIGYNTVVFTDVNNSAWYKGAIDFISARGITSGIGENKFGPDAKLTRAQFVVLLMNAYQINPQNQVDLSQTQNFSDTDNTYYTNYLKIAKSLGIVNGVGNNLFAPEKEITRQEMFVMLHNALKVIDEIPEAVISRELSSFNDSNQIDGWANEAFTNLVNAGIVTGSNNKLNPTHNTTRAEIAQVLCNLFTK
jgi:hypothetical protein